MRAFYIISLFFISISFQSCVVVTGKKGNGNVTKENRPVSEFSGIKSSAGIDVLITQGNENQIVVETDENLQKYIETEIENDVLKIYPSTSIRRSKALKVHVTCTNIENLTASSASSIRSVSEIKSRNLSVETSSGATATLEILSENIEISTSSGSDVKITGQTLNLNAQSSSGSKIYAINLQAVNCIAKASSGSNIYVNVKDKLEASASSGADIRFSGNPRVSTKESSGGSVRQRN